MSEFIVLSLVQCDKLFPVNPRTGERTRISKQGHALCPIPLAGDLEFILPLEVLSDPHHAEALKAIAAQPYDVKAIDALPVDQKPQPIAAKDAVDLKSLTVRRVVQASEFKVDTLDSAPIKDQPIDAPIDVPIDEPVKGL